MDHMDEPVTRYMRTDTPIINASLNIGEALELIRAQGVGERIVYFYVVDDEQRVVGVLPTRRLLTEPPEHKVIAAMITRVRALPQTATVFDACEFFALHRFLAAPVVNERQQIVGTIDVTLFTEEIADLTEREQVHQMFETIGYRFSEVRQATPLRMFRYRFPWLLTTITGGTLCAILAGTFGTTIAESVILAFFLTLVLGLGESVSIQSLMVTIQALHAQKPSGTWYVGALKREFLSALLLGLGSGAIVGTVVMVLHSDHAAAGIIGGSVLLSLIAACLVGLSVPSMLHALRLDPKIASGPIVLAIADLCTITIYFGTATIAL